MNSFLHEMQSDLDDCALSTCEKLASLSSIIGISGVVSPSFGKGLSGIGLCMQAAHLVDPKSGWNEVATAYAKFSAVHALNLNLRQSFYSGSAGVAFAIMYLNDSGDCPLFPLIEGAVQFVHQITSVSAGKRFLRSENFDIISGVCGTGIMLLKYFEQTGDPTCLPNLVRWLTEWIGNCKDDTVFTVNPTHQLDPMLRKQFPNGCINLGFAHGLAGVLAFLSLAQLAGVVNINNNEEQAILRLAEVFERTCHRDRFGPTWDHAVTTCNPEVRHSTGGVLGGRTAWCYGPLGISRALALAGRACCVDNLYQLGLDAACSSLERFPDHESPTLCHGLSGALLCANLFLMETGKSCFAEFIQRGVGILLDDYSDNHKFGFQSINGSKIRDYPWFLDGAAGVAMTLLALTRCGSTGIERALAIL